MIIHSDSISALESLPDNSIDLCFTSPSPIFFEKNGIMTSKDYDNNNNIVIGAEDNSYDYVMHLVSVFDHVKRVLKPKASCFVQMGDYYVNNVLTFVPWLFSLNMINAKHQWYCPAQLIWHRPICRDKIDKLHSHGFIKDVEYLFQFTKHPTDYDFDIKGTSELWQSSILNYQFDLEMQRLRNDDIDKDGGGGKDNNKLFDSGFPESMISMAIRTTVKHSRLGKIVLDPFAGSGVTGVVAKKFGMDYIMIDINKTNCEGMHRRLD